MPRKLPHPAKAVIVGRGEQLNEVAAACDINPGTFGRILNGYVEAYPALRKKLSEYLGKPESELFYDRDADLERLVSDTRAAQGLPPTITDPSVLAQIAALLVAAEKRGPGEVVPDAA